jgi:hypothetical protein
MPVIADLSIEDFRAMVDRFDQRYVVHWNSWLEKCDDEGRKVTEFGRILRSWQAFRPNVMRRPEAESQHKPPYLETVIAQADPYIEALAEFDITQGEPITSQEREALTNLWQVLLQLSFEGKKKTKRKGLAGVVGISKAVLLLTKGRVGPAFDSEVRKRLCLCEPEDSAQWIQALEVAKQDIHAFQEKNQCSLQEAAPQRFKQINSGRIYDMALGPRG